MIEPNEEVIIAPRLNFRILVPQLKDGFKLKVCLGEADPTDIFEISPKSNEYLIKLIKKDVSLRLPNPEKPKMRLVARIKSIYQKLSNK